VVGLGEATRLTGQDVIARDGIDPVAHHPVSHVAIEGQ
jgi:hypothetical protein